MSDSFRDIGDSPFEGTAANPKLALFFPRHSQLVSSLQEYSLESTARIIGGMLTMPDFQASTIRLEVLQHLIVSCCTGTSEAKPPDIAAWLTDLGGGYAGMLEDPAEDVFVSRVSGPEADYLVFEGVYEAAGYCLQRFLNVLQTMPAEEPFAALNRSALTLLRLADEVATRADLSAHMVGVEQPLQDVPLDLIEKAVGSANGVSFTSEEITALGIREEDLEPFVFDLDAAHVLREERLGSSSLERWPLLRIGESYILALPSAVSMAIRRLIIEVCISAGVAKELYQAYAKEVAASVADTPLLSGAGSGTMPFHRVAGIFVCNMARHVDQGRLLHLCFLVDDFAGYEESGVVDPRPGTDIYGKVVGESIQHIADSVENEPDLREAITLVVLCSWGRPIATQFDSTDDARWRIESISAADLEALSWASAFSPHKLWSLLDARDALAVMDVELLNVNGLLNLFAWSEQLDGHLVPHGDLPDESLGGPLVIFVQQNSLLDIRRRGAQTWDVHRARSPDGTLVQVRRLREDSIFTEDRDKPLYASFDDVKEGRLVAVYKTARRGWWLTTECPDTSDRDLQWRLWHALTTWLERSADLLETQYPALPVGAIAWQCVFEDDGLSDPEAIIPNEEEARRLIRVETDGNTVRVIARRGYCAFR